MQEESDKLVCSDFIASFAEGYFWDGVGGLVLGELEVETDGYGTFCEFRHFGCVVRPVW